MVARAFQRFWVWSCLLLVTMACFSPLVVQAERPAIKLAVQKVKGDDLFGRVAGIFRVSVQEPEEVSAVTFYLDGKVIAHANSEPYAFQLDTSDFDKGEHTIEAVGYMEDGAVTGSNTISLDFRSKTWHLAARWSMFLYAALLLLILSAAGTLGMRRLLRLHPRLILLERQDRHGPRRTVSQNT